jgi:UDP-glucose:(heptosyl)LPS alpha-1,3-glucosyltransferase
MRIAFVVHDYHLQGGHSRYCVELAERFAREHEVHIFANGFPPGASLYPGRAPAGEGLFFHRVPAYRGSALGTVLSFYVPATLAIAKHGPFDIVHAQGFVCHHYHLLTAHICCAAWHAQRLASGHSFGAKEKLFDAVVMRLERWLYPRKPARPVIAISRRVAADLEGYCGRRGGIAVVPHGVDPVEFDFTQRENWRRSLRAQLDWPEQRFVALWVGDLRKGAQSAMEAVAGNPDLHFAAVSRNDPAPFREFANRLGLKGRAHFFPPTGQIAHFYAAADAFIFPTTYDAFGMVVLEAMAMGLPVIVSRDAGAAELITHDRDGLLLENPSDARQCGAWLDRLAKDAGWRERLGSAAAETALRQGWDAVAAQTMRIYMHEVEKRQP